MEEEPAKDDIPLPDSTQIRLKLVELCISSTLQYAALATALAVVWATLLGYAGSPGDDNALWLVEGVLVVLSGHLVLNSAYYGRMAGLVGNQYVGIEYEEVKLNDVPTPTYRRDYLSRINYRYVVKTKEVKFLKSFGNVFAWRRFALFVGMGIVGGLIIAIV